MAIAPTQAAALNIHETLYRIEISCAGDDPIIAGLIDLQCKWDGQARVWWVGRRHPNANEVRNLVRRAARPRRQRGGLYDNSHHAPVDYHAAGPSRYSGLWD